jgi:hypothetical protein
LSQTQLSTSGVLQPPVTLGAQQSPLHSPQPSPATSVTQTLSHPSLQQRGSAAHTQAVIDSSAQLPPTWGEQHAPSGSAGCGSEGAGVPASLGSAGAVGVGSEGSGVGGSSLVGGGVNGSASGGVAGVGVGLGAGVLGAPPLGGSAFEGS